jgi:hypothetical protein
LAGCIGTLKTMEFGHGGFGLILSRGALELLDAPLANHNDRFLHTILSPWTKKSKLELKGLSLIELSAKIAKDNVHHQNWIFRLLHAFGLGPCLHSLLRRHRLHRSIDAGRLCQMTGDKCLKTLDDLKPPICHFAFPAIMQTICETNVLPNTIVM